MIIKVPQTEDSIKVAKIGNSLVTEFSANFDFEDEDNIAAFQKIIPMLKSAVIAIPQGNEEQAQPTQSPEPEQTNAFVTRQEFEQAMQQVMEQLQQMQGGQQQQEQPPAQPGMEQAPPPPEQAPPPPEQPKQAKILGLV